MSIPPDLDRPELPAGGTLLRPDTTCWRLETASRVALLVDGAAYFAAAVACRGRARRSVTLIGWSFDPLTRLASRPRSRPPPVGRALPAPSRGHDAGRRPR